MIHWAWLILAFYVGAIGMLLLTALLQANGTPTPAEDAQQAAWLAARTRDDGTPHE